MTDARLIIDRLQSWCQQALVDAAIFVMTAAAPAVFLLGLLLLFAISLFEGNT